MSMEAEESYNAKAAVGAEKAKLPKKPRKKTVYRYDSTGGVAGVEIWKLSKADKTRSLYELDEVLNARRRKTGGISVNELLRKGEYSKKTKEGKGLK